jgi:hypothetical protein
VVDVTVSQSIVLGARHQGTVDCSRHEDGHHFRCGVSSLEARKACTGCRQHLSADPSCFGSCFRTSVKLFERTGS